MTNELQGFINHFPNEEELRSAIEGLLLKREDCFGVRNLHGKDEHGKDLIFYAPSAIGRPRLHACVVKLSKTTGSASDARSGARNVLIQCNQALDTPVVNTQGQEEWVSHIYVMCPNELGATAMQSISGEFKGKASQVEFICGNDFLQMFKQLWPDFIFFQPDLLSAHLDTLGKELASDKNIQQLATAHGLSAIAQKKNIYVEPFLSQAVGRLQRAKLEFDPSKLREVMSLEGIDKLGNDIEALISSLEVVDYLPPYFQKRTTKVMANLSKWPSRFKKSWSDAINQATSEAYKDNPKARRITLIQIPTETIDQFLASSEYNFTTEVHKEIDHAIEQSNTCIEHSVATVELLTDPCFAGYGSLLHAATVHYPTIEFTSEHRLLEWSPINVLANRPNILVTGAPGFGKTSFCRNHFLTDLNRFRTGESRILPLYFAAHSLAVTPQQGFEEVFLRREVAARLAADASIEVRIYLDGLDEVQSTETRDRILEIVKHACIQDNSRYQCIATAREHVGGYWTHWLARVRLSPMSEENVRALVTAWLDGESELISQFYSELSLSESLLPVIRVPLLATLTVLVFKSLRRLPENRLRLYQMFIDLLLGGWNLAKGLQRSSQYSSSVKGLVLTRLAGLMHTQRRNECTNGDVASAVRQVAPKLSKEIQAVISELVEDGLLSSTGRSTYVFPHLSFQEYLAAKDAMDPSRQEDERIVKAYLSGDDWYKEVVIFLVSMATNPVTMRAWIVKLAKGFRTYGTLSEGEKRAASLIAKLGDVFPECKASTLGINDPETGNKGSQDSSGSASSNSK